MSTKALEKKITELSKQVAYLQTLVITGIMGFDPEGEYKPSFVKKALKAEKEPAIYSYEGPGSLLKQLKQFKSAK